MGQGEGERGRQQLVSRSMQTGEALLDPAKRLPALPAPDGEFAAEAARRCDIWAERVDRGQLGEGFETGLGVVEVGVPQVYGQRPDQGDAMSDWMLQLSRCPQGFRGHASGSIGVALQPEGPRQRDAGPVAVIEAIVDRPAAFGRKAKPKGRLQFDARQGLVAGQVVRHP
ncbi:MAG: hypothetical protein JF570_12660 [Caulobacter sp.]|nr:hypothetical protein [Caulobacter sp.]